MRGAAGLGFPAADAVRRNAAVMERLRRIRARISHHDSARRFRDELGVDVFLGTARFASADSFIEVGGGRALHSGAP
ncbi:MAG: hypothetical protein U0842_12475 [Candidatus Binatia bacterium]